MNTNLWTSNWLKVLYLNGEIKKVSLETVLLEAHEIKKLMPIGENVITTYTIYDFLINFIQWVYKPIGYDDDSSKKAILNLYKMKHFDKEILDKYYDYYQNRLGKSFDIFDEKNPFLQISKAEFEKLLKDKILREKDDIKYNSFPKFGLERLGGNNSVFEHRKNFIPEKEYKELCEKENRIVPLEQTYKLDTEDIVASLLYCHGFSQASGGGSTASVSVAYGKGQHPIFVLIEGSNLFETICLNIGTARSYKSKPMWERESYFASPDSLILENANSYNSIPLSYVPTVYVRFIDDKKCWFRAIDKKKFGNTKNLSELYPLWVDSYPRIIKVTENENNSKHAMTYNYSKYVSKDEKDSTPELETKLLSVGAHAKSCTVLNTNFEVLKNLVGDYSVKFYACTHRNASETSILEMSRIMEWPKRLDLPNSETATAIIEKFIPTIASMAETTGFYLTVGKGLATGACKEDPTKNKRYERFTFSGKKIGKFSYDASSIITSAVNECIWILQTKEYEKLLNIEEDDDKTVESLIEECFSVFKNVFFSNIRSINKLPMLKRIELIDFWKRNINSDRKEIYGKFEL